MPLLEDGPKAEKLMVTEGFPLKNHKILFVTPPYRCGVVDIVGRWVPLGFVYLAGTARMAGLRAEIYDAAAKNHGFREIEQYFKHSDASYIASTALTASINDAVKTLELAKTLNPAVITILGGIHPTFCFPEVLKSAHSVDYIVCGEGEETLVDLLHCLENGGDPDDIPGIAFRRAGEVVKTVARQAIENIDTLKPAWDLLDWSDYKYFVIPDSRLAVISTSRTKVHSGKSCKASESVLRFREPGRVVDEIVYLNETYGVNVFLLADDCPTGNRRRWELLLDLLISRDLSLFIMLQTCSGDIVRDSDIIWKYRQAGVVHVYVDLGTAGIASSAAHAPDPEVKRALTLLHDHGIISEASFVVGGAEETMMSVERTFNLAQSYNPDNAQFIAMTPWPYDDTFAAVKQYIRVYDYSRYNFFDPIMEPKEMSLQQVDAAIVGCYRKYFMGKMLELMRMKDKFKRDYLMRAMKLIVGSSFILKKMGIEILNKIPTKVKI